MMIGFSLKIMFQSCNSNRDHSSQCNVCIHRRWDRAGLVLGAAEIGFGRRRALFREQRGLVLGAVGLGFGSGGALFWQRRGLVLAAVLAICLWEKNEVAMSVCKIQ